MKKETCRGTEYTGVLVAYFFIVAIITFPLIFKINHYILGSFGGYFDLPWELWFDWYVKYSLINLKPLFFTDIVHYPVGVNVLMDCINFLNPVLSLVFQIFFNVTTSYNVLCLVLLTLNAVGAYFLIRYLIKDKTIAFISGIIYAFNPYIITEISYGRAAQASAGWIPLYLLFLFKTLKENKTCDLILAVLFLVLTCLSSWYSGMAVIIFTLCYVIYLAISRDFKAASFKMIAIFFVLFIMAILPFVYVLIKAEGSGSMGGFFRSVFSLDDSSPNAFFSVHSVLRNSLELGFPLRNVNYMEHISKRISPLVLLFSFIPILFNTKKPKFWIFSSLFFYILCLGPYLKIGEKICLIHGKMIPLPYLFLNKFIPFFWQFRWPDRFIVMIMLSLAVLCAHNLLFIYTKLNIHKWKRLFFSGIFAWLLIVEIPILSLVDRFPVPVSNAEAPSYYHTLAREEDCAIIQYPFISDSYPQASIYGYYQTIHKKKMLAGACNLTQLYQPGQREFIYNNTFIYSLLILQDNPAFVLQFKKEDIEALKSIGFKYLIVHADFLGTELSGAVIRQLKHIFDAPKVYPGGILVYHL